MWFVGKSELLSLIQCHCLDEVMPAFSDHRTLRKNAVIYRPDESSEHVYLLKSGSVRLYRLTEDGQEITLAFVKAGMIFGDGDVLNEESYSHHAQALTPSMVCYIRKADFKELLARYDVINQFVLRNHYLRWQEAQQLIENLSLHDVRKRLVNILVMFSGQVGTPLEHPEHGDTILIDLPIAQDKLAEFIGTSRESVNRHFSDLKAEGFVDMHERKIVLTPAFITRYITKAPAFAALPANPAPHVFRVPLMRA